MDGCVCEHMLELVREMMRVGLSERLPEWPRSFPPSPGPSRRSDLQTLGYCLLKWLYGTLPWTNCLPNTEEIMKLKQK